MVDSSTVSERVPYPPPHQILSALGIEVCWAENDMMRGRIGVGVELLGRDGRTCGVGALVPLVDIVAGAQASALVDGDWIVTSDAWLHEYAPIEVGPVEVTARVLRGGRRTFVTSVEVTADGRPAVASTIEFTRIGRRVDRGSTRPVQPERWTRMGSGPLLDQPLERACGLRVVRPAAGVVEIDLSPFVANSTGTFQGGVMGLLADASAAAVIGPDARTIDLQYRFLAAAGEGPARSQAEVLRSDGRYHTVRVEVVDAADGQLVGWAICGVQDG